MLRVAFSEALLFFLPFALFALYLIVRKRNPFSLAHWIDQTFWLVAAGLVCAAAAFVYTGITAER